MNRHNIELLILGFFQLVFLSANTFFISKASYTAIIVSCFITNIFFSFSVKKLAFSDWSNRVMYSIGCTGGCVVGTWLATIV